MIGKIYLITNLVNGKQYVGQTKQPIKFRWKDHNSKNKVTTGLLHRAIKKYGKDKFSIEVIYDCIDNQLELDRLEVITIDKHNTVAPNGYNLSKGGRGGNGKRVVSKEHFEAICARYLDGVSSITLSRQYKVAAGTIQRILLENGIPLRNAAQAQSKLLDKDKEYVCELYEQYKTCTELAKILGVSDASVRRFLLRHGVSLKGQGKFQLGKKRKKQSIKSDCDNNIEHVDLKLVEKT